MRLEYQIFAAVLLDMLLGDPRRLPHPVKYIGRLAQGLEHPMRGLIRNARAAGIVTALLTIAATGATALALMSVSRGLHPALGDAAGIVLIYTALAARDLGAHGARVYRALRSGDIEQGRRAVGMIVGRDVDTLTEGEVTRAAVETVAENLVDGVTAPLFFATLGGPVAALCYKAVSTLDSTFGYRNERYELFGWASARLDDVANWVPARLTMPFIALAAALCGLRAGKSLQIAWRDRKRHDSPNAAIPEAAFAGALQVQLGGLNYYGGEAHEKPTLGDAVQTLAPAHIARANMLMYISAALFALGCIGMRRALG